MPRTSRVAPGGYVYHVLNRGVGRRSLFDKPADFQAFEAILAEMLELAPIRVLAYCLMPNHWHFVLWPEGDGELATFMQRLTITHVTRWQKHRGKVGEGHLYQGRYKSFPVETNDHFYQILRYVERNALRAGLVERAEAWRWGSLWQRAERGPLSPILAAPWPAPEPARWTELVNQPQHETELAALRRCVQRGRPYGSQSWVRTTAALLGLESTLRPRGRPKAGYETNI